MLKPLRRTAHAVDRKIGFSRIGFAVSLTIIIVAAVVLYRILRDIDPDQLLDALEATDWRTLIIAGCFVAAGYLTLTFYDLFALRTIGRADMPYRAAALGGFTSYAVGHNVGASVFSGGAVRYRIYSGWGLSVIEVTKICFVAGLTFWLGNATVLGLGILYAPQAARAIDQLPLWLNRSFAARASCHARRLCRLGGGQAARDRPRGLAGEVARRRVDASADRDRHRRSILLRGRHVHAGARRAESRLRHGGGDFRRRHAARALPATPPAASACSTPP